MRVVLVVVTLLLSMNAFAKEIKCQVDEMTTDDVAVEVPVTVVQGAQLVETKTLSFKGIELSAVWNTGDRFESQTKLTMTYGDLTSAMYDVNFEGQNGPLNVITQNFIRFQCWVE